MPTPRVFRRYGRLLRAAAPASAGCAAQQSRPPAPLYRQTGALYSLRTNIPSCKNAEGGKWLTTWKIALGENQVKKTSAVKLSKQP